LAPKARPIPTTNNKTNDAAIFMAFPIPISDYQFAVVLPRNSIWMLVVPMIFSEIRKNLHSNSGRLLGPIPNCAGEQFKRASKTTTLTTFFRDTAGPALISNSGRLAISSIAA